MCFVVCLMWLNLFDPFWVFKEIVFNVLSQELFLCSKKGSAAPETTSPGGDSDSTTASATEGALERVSSFSLALLAWWCRGEGKCALDGVLASCQSSLSGSFAKSSLA